MFLREFPIEDIMIMWDFILWEVARDYDLLQCIENISASMVYFVRDYLMNPKVHFFKTFLLSFVSLFWALRREKES